MVNVANPASPVLQGTVTTPLAGIGGLAVRNALIVVGESASNCQARVAAIDFSNPMAPAVVGTAHTVLISSAIISRMNSTEPTAARIARVTAHLTETGAAPTNALAEEPVSEDLLQPVR
jgi:hypothetical protein